MVYKITVFLTEKEISVLQIRDGEERFMSFRGNTSMPIESVDDVDDFIEHCYDEYNINDFSELDFEVFVVNAGGDKAIYYALINAFKNCKTVNAAEVRSLLLLALATKQSVKKGQTVVVGFLGSTYKAVCDETGYTDIEDSAEKPKITLETGDFSFLHDVNISGFAGDEDEIKRIKAEYENKLEGFKSRVREYKEKQDKILKEAQKTIQKLQEENRKYKPFYEAAEEERKKSAAAHKFFCLSFKLGSGQTADFTIKYLFNNNSDQAYQAFEKGVSLKKGQKIGRLRIYKQDRIMHSIALTFMSARDGEYENEYVKVTYITAPENGIFYFFKKYLEKDSQNDPNVLTSGNNDVSFPVISVNPNEAIGVYANAGDTRETAIAWYNKTYNQNEE